MSKLDWTRDELLADLPYDEPLVAGGVRCHGGFRGGRYVSPRTANRVPAIDAWQARLRAEGHRLVDVPRAFVPPHYPNYPQAKLLLQEGVRDPVTRSLTLISIVEGFGARIRELSLPDLRKEVVEDLSGTALSHLEGGLFEAHARDEAGWREEGGHKQMWEAARDLGLAKPEIPDDVLLAMMMGGGRGERKRLFPELSHRLEDAITFMANVMVVEIFAEDVFEWAKKLLGDPEVSADPAGAPALVSHIQADEKPHVEYLRTALSELRARTLRSHEGKSQISGQRVIDGILETQLRQMASTRPQRERADVQKAIRLALDDAPRAAALATRFEGLDSGWAFPEHGDPRLELTIP
ncbi:MAG TPA: hypothetical protein VMR50_06525 [Myxococcota bacterium]|nr:hypothetical protein [Myxococcota bacterium]